MKIRDFRTACLSALATAGCHAVTEPRPPSVATVTVAPPSVVIVIGLTQQFTAALADSAGNVMTGRPIQWSSADTTTVTIDQTGVATAVGLGITTVTAKSGTASGSATVYGQFICKCAPSGPTRPTTSQCACAP